MKNSYIKKNDLISITALSIFSVVMLFYYLSRPLWYDESLTLLKFVPLSYSRIYTDYSIPNNHIVYTWILKFFTKTLNNFFSQNEILLRVPSGIFIILSIILLFKLLRSRTSQTTAIFACCLFICSQPFIIYGSAIRGYSLSFLLVISGLYFCQKWLIDKKKLFSVLFFISVLIGVGAIPSNIIIFSIIPLIPTEQDKNATLALSTQYLKKRLSVLFLALLAFMIFYLPIIKKLYHALKNNNGWLNSPGAIIHLYSAFTISFLPLIILALFKNIFSAKKTNSHILISTYVYTLIFTLPVLFLLRHPVPFPRVFFQFWPIWIFIISLPADEFIQHHLQFSKKYASLIILLIIFIIGVIEKSFASSFSAYLKPKTSQDDFFKPYYMRNSFHPEAVVEMLNTSNLQKPIFLSVFADYPSLYFYSKLKKYPDSMWLFDAPNFKTNTTLNQLTVVVKNYYDLKIRMNQFNMNSFSIISESPNQIVVLLKK
jgi:hypothetical protein